MELKIENIPRNKIVIPKWQPRKDDEPNEELIQSIKQKGLINPITVRGNGEKFEVVAGVRRIKALDQLKNGSIPCTSRSDDDVDAKITALNENNVRQDLDDLENETFVYDLWVEGKGSGKWKSIREMEKITGMTHETLGAVIRGHEERLNLGDISHSDELTYDDFYRSRPLEKYPEIRKTVLEKRANREIESQQELHKISKRLAEFPEEEQQQEELERILERKKKYHKEVDELEEHDYQRDVEIAQGLREPEHIVEDDPDELRFNNIKSKCDEILWLTPATIKIIDNVQFRKHTINILKKTEGHIHKLLMTLREYRVVDGDAKN